MWVVVEEDRPEDEGEKKVKRDRERIEEKSSRPPMETSKLMTILEEGCWVVVEEEDESRLRCRSRGVQKDRWGPKRRLGSVVCLLQEKIGLEPRGFDCPGCGWPGLAWVKGKERTGPAVELTGQARENSSHC